VARSATAPCRWGCLAATRPTVFDRNPWFRLLRREVMALVQKKHGGAHLRKKLVETELAQINKKLRAMKVEMKALEAKKGELEAVLKGQ